jgi:hypothetical protein
MRGTSLSEALAIELWLRGPTAVRGAIRSARRDVNFSNDKDFR